MHDIMARTKLEHALQYCCFSLSLICSYRGMEIEADDILIKMKLYFQP